MPADLDCLTIKDLKMLLHIQHEKVAREAEVKRLVEEVVCKAEQLAAEVATQKAEEEAKEKVRRAKKAMEVVGSRSDTEPGLLQKKVKVKARAESVEATEEFGEVCQQ
jgi:hypothetical protein